MKEKHLQTCNRLILLLFMVIFVAVTAGNIGEVLKGHKTIAVTIGYSALAAIIMVILSIFYHRDSTTPFIKKYGFTLFFILYVYTLFATTRVMVSIYVYPVLFMYTMFFDPKQMRRIAFSVTGINILRVLWLVIIVSLNDKSSVSDYTILLAGTAVICWGCALSNRLTTEYNNGTLHTIKTSHEQQDMILNEVLSIGNSLDTYSNDMYSIVSELEQSTDAMNTTMSEMESSFHDATQSIEKQTMLTENIQSEIDDTSNAAKKMEQISITILNKMRDGMAIVDDLSENASIISENGSIVHQAMTELKEKTNEISRITDTINAMANKTNMLSLNASIESARAGEAGRGFAVVAKDVGELALQTANSVVEISAIIQDLQRMVEHSVNAVADFQTANKAQDTLIFNTESIFKDTSAHVDEVHLKVAEVSNKVDTILLSNEGIMQNINIITDTSANALDGIKSTLAATRSNRIQVEETKHIGVSLLESSARLKKYL